MGLAAASIFVRTASVAAFGQWSVLLAIAMPLSILVEAGLCSAVLSSGRAGTQINWGEYVCSRRGRLHVFLLGLGLLIAVGANFQIDSRIVGVVMLSLGFAGQRLTADILRLDGKFGRAAFVDGGTFAIATLSFVFLLDSGSLAWFSAAVGASTLLTTFLVAGVREWRVKSTPPAALNVGHAHWVAGSDLVRLLYTQLDVVLVGLLFSPEDVGSYSLAKRLLVLVASFQAVVASASRGRLSVALQFERKSDVRRVMVYMTVVSSSVLVPVCLFVSTVPDFVLMSVFSTSTVTAERVLALGMVAVAVGALTGPSGTLLLLSPDRRIVLFRISVTGVAVYLVFLIGSLGSIGILGVAMAQVSALVYVNVAQAWVAWRDVGGPGNSIEADVEA